MLRYAVRLLVSTAFVYRKSRLQYLFEMLRCFAEFPVERVDVVLVTEASSAEANDVKELLNPLRTSRLSVAFDQCSKNPGDPYLLTWEHKRLIRDRFLSQTSDYTHFVYLEDDMRLSWLNFFYFLQFREMLRPHSLLPGFMRYEYNTTLDRLFLTDHVKSLYVGDCPTIQFGPVRFVSQWPPYQGMYILDRELAEEHISSRSFDLEESKAYGYYGVPERANMAQTWENYPGHLGFSSRYVVPFDEVTMLPIYDCLVQHLPGNYTNIKSPFGHGTLPADAAFLSGKP